MPRGLMEENNVRRIIVIDPDGYMCGIVTDADVLEAETAESVVSPYDPGFDGEWLTVRDVMTADVIAIGPEASVGQLVEKLMETKIGGVPVVQPAGPPRRAAPARRHCYRDRYFSTDQRSVARRRSVEQE